jgi:rare lipoprotein A (peptidoglycan hydrolase)
MMILRKWHCPICWREQMAGLKSPKRFERVAALSAMIIFTLSFVVEPARAERASWYDEPQGTASGELFNPEAMTAAMWDVPFGTLVECCRQSPCVKVRINDRGPARRLHRDIDLSRGAARVLGILEAGVAQVTMRIVGLIDEPNRDASRLRGAALSHGHHSIRSERKSERKRRLQKRRDPAMQRERRPELRRKQAGIRHRHRLHDISADHRQVVRPLPSSVRKSWFLMPWSKMRGDDAVRGTGNDQPPQ